MKQIDILPDDILLEIFDFYVDMSLSYKDKAEIEKWQSLIHVCRQWRSLVLGSPRRLNLRLFTTPKTPVRDTLDIWPALPLSVGGKNFVQQMFSLRHDSNSNSIFGTDGNETMIYLIPGTFHPKRWPLPSPCCPVSEYFTLNSYPLNLALTGKPEVCLHQNDLLFPLSIIFVSRALLNI